MKPAAEWQEADLLQLIADQEPERTELEYKACDALRHGTGKPREKVIEELSRDVSAMGNAAGGVIVYGIAEKKNVPQELDGFDPAATTKEWLEQIIQSNIKPTPHGVMVRPVPLGGPLTGKVAYVVGVPVSPRGWQANDGRYYRRHSFTRLRLEDHEIRELMSRSERPDILVRLEWLALPRKELTYYPSALLAVLVNTGPVLVRHWKVVIDFPEDLVEERQPGPPGDKGVIEENRVHYRRFEFRNGPSEPLFPRDHVKLFGSEAPAGLLHFVVSDRDSANIMVDDLAMRWTGWADNMQPKQERVLLRQLLGTWPPLTAAR